MKTLREEIENKVMTALFHANEKRGTEIQEICTNEILKLIEKRIDILKQKIPTYTSQDMPTTQYYAGQREMIKKLKEMLK